MKSKNVPTLTEGLLHNFFWGGRGIPHTHADRFKKTSTSMHGKPKIPCGSWHRCGYNALLGLPQFAFLQKLTLFILEKKFEISSVRKSPLLVFGHLVKNCLVFTTRKVKSWVKSCLTESCLTTSIPTYCSASQMAQPSG